MFEGTDEAGNACRLFVENNGYFSVGSRPEILQAAPVFISDSPLLQEKLSGPYFRSEIHPCAGGVTNRVFDLRQEEKQISSVPVRQGDDPETVREELKDHFLSLPEEKQRKAAEAASKIKAAGVPELAVFYYAKDGGTYVWRKDEMSGFDPEIITGALFDSANVLFLIIGGNLSGLYSTAGRINDIPDEAVGIFQQMLEAETGTRVFERPLNSYRKRKLM
jgi:hypothetical protein